MCLLGNAKVLILIIIPKCCGLIYSKSNMAQYIFPYLFWSCCGWFTVVKVVCVLCESIPDQNIFLRPNSYAMVMLYKNKYFSFPIENVLRCILKIVLMLFEYNILFDTTLFHNIKLKGNNDIIPPLMTFHTNHLFMSQHVQFLLVTTSLGTVAVLYKKNLISTTK